MHDESYPLGELVSLAVLCYAAAVGSFILAGLAVSGGRVVEGFVNAVIGAVIASLPVPMFVLTSPSRKEKGEP